MSSRTTRPNGHQWVFFKFKKRHTVRLGNVSVADAEDFRRRLDRLIATRDLGLPIEPELRQWLTTIGDRPHATLVKAGLTKTRAASDVTQLVAFYLDRLKADRAAKSTIDNAQVLCNNLTEYFEDAQLSAIGTPEADKFREWLERDGRVKSDDPLAVTTVSRRCRRAREIFDLALGEGWIERNPFDLMKEWTDVDDSRDVYVTREIVERLIRECPDHEFRLVLALVRYCGVRCPSEIRPLELSWANRETETIRIFAQKNKRYNGKAWKTAPLFPEVQEHIAEVHERAATGQTLMFINYQTTGAAITGKLQRLCNSLEIENWPKPWVNLRASGIRDLMEGNPIDKVADWVGTSPQTLLKHYNRVAKERAAREAASSALRVEDDSKKAKQKAKRRMASRKSSAASYGE